jgi:hypothetical protein
LPDSLWGNWKQYDLPANSVIVLVFDQFEEFFTYPLPLQEEFKKQLAELLYSSYPAYLYEHEDELTEEQYDLSAPLEVRSLFAEQPIANGQIGVEAFLLQVLCNEIENKVQNGEVKDLDNNGLPPHVS